MCAVPRHYLCTVSPSLLCTVSRHRRSMMACWAEIGPTQSGPRSAQPFFVGLSPAHLLGPAQPDLFLYTLQPSYFWVPTNIKIYIYIYIYKKNLNNVVLTLFLYPPRALPKSRARRTSKREEGGVFLKKERERGTREGGWKNKEGESFF